MSRGRKVMAGLFVLQLVAVLLLVAGEVATRWWLDNEADKPTWRRFAITPRRRTRSLTARGRKLKS